MTTSTPSTYWHPKARDYRMSANVEDSQSFHERLPGYEVSPLIELPSIASELGVGRVFVKDESHRYGLPAFKALGAVHAVLRVLARRWSLDHANPDLEQFRLLAAQHPEVRLFAATDGNHGRAVARVAGLINLPATIYFPSAISSTAKQAIRDEGAHTVELDAPYDEVVLTMAQAALDAGDNAEIIQDTSWSGYTDVPQWIVDGYHTIFHEVDAQLAEQNVTGIDLIAVPAGVGSLAQAVVHHYRSTQFTPSVLVVEPEAAPAVFASLNSGKLVSVPTGDTVMAGMNCGTPSMLAWPVLRDGADAAVLVSDVAAMEAMSALQAAGVNAGPCGAAGLAGVRSFIKHNALPEHAVVVLLNTEDATANPIEERRQHVQSL